MALSIAEGIDAFEGIVHESRMFHPNTSIQDKPSEHFSVSSDHQPGTLKKKQNLIVLHKKRSRA